MRARDLNRNLLSLSGRPLEIGDTFSPSEGFNDVKLSFHEACKLLMHIQIGRTIAVEEEKIIYTFVLIFHAEQQ